MSLWSVPDEAARRWMTAFYGRVLAGKPVHEAAREASLENLAAQRVAGLSTHPYLWAGFVAAGDWR
jgi:CHAT domain-containing protein